MPPPITSGVKLGIEVKSEVKTRCGLRGRRPDTTTDVQSQEGLKPRHLRFLQVRGPSLPIDRQQHLVPINHRWEVAHLYLHILDHVWGREREDEVEQPGEKELVSLA